MLTTGNIFCNKIVRFSYFYLRFCTVADELNDKIYMLGGYYKTTKAYRYTISTNSWSAMWDSSLTKSSKVSEIYGRSI